MCAGVVEHPFKFVLPLSQKFALTQQILSERLQVLHGRFVRRRVRVQVRRV